MAIIKVLKFVNGIPKEMNPNADSLSALSIHLGTAGSKTELTKALLDTLLGGGDASSLHNHDTQYYTKSEVDGLVDGKDAANEISYDPTAIGNSLTSTTVQGAIDELEAALDAATGGASDEDLTFVKLNGSRPMTGSLDFTLVEGSAVHKITGLADGVNPKDAVNKSQLESVASDAASDATSKANAAQAAAIAAASSDATSKANAAQAAAIADAATKYIPLTQKGAVNGVATLNSDGKLSASQVPSIAITSTFVVADETAMLAITTAEEGDVAVRTDLNKSFILGSGDRTQVASWIELLSPTDAVQSVNGQSGTVDLDTDDIDEGAVNQYFTDARAVSALSTITGGLQTAIDLPEQQFKHVAKNGNDSTGNGSRSKPFLTIAAANASITDAYFTSNSDFKRYVVSIGPGVYLEAPGFEFKTHVTYASTGGRGATSVSVSSGNIVWNVPEVASPKVNLYNISIFSPIVITSSNTINVPVLEAYHLFTTSQITWNNAVGNNEKQLIAFSATKASGVYRLNLGGSQSADINWNDSAATVQSKIEAMLSIGAGNVSVVASGENFEVEFVGALAKQNISAFTVSNNTLQDSGPSAITVTITESVLAARQPQYQIRYSRLGNIVTTGNVFGFLEYCTHGTITHGSASATSIQGSLQRIYSTSGFSTVSVNAGSYTAVGSYAENTVIHDRSVLGSKTLSYTSDSIRQNSLVVTGTFTQFRLSDALNINYSPAVSGNWDSVVPTEAKAALDQLASRVKLGEADIANLEDAAADAVLDIAKKVDHSASFPAGEALVAGDLLVAKYVIANTRLEVFKASSAAAANSDFNDGKWAVIAAATSSVSAGASVDAKKAIGDKVTVTFDSAPTIADAGKSVYLGSSGQATLTAPSAASSGIVYIGIVASATEIFLCPAQLRGVNAEE